MIPAGRPPRPPSSTIKIPHTAAVPTALSPISRATSHRRASRARATRTTTTPNEPAWYTTVTSQVMLHGGGWITCAMARSTRESYRITSRQHTKAKTAAASRTPSLPRRRRWPSPTGANMTERQLRRRDCSGTELSLSARPSVIPLKLPSGGQDLRLLLIELRGCDDPSVAQVSQLGQLIGRARRTRSLLDVAASLLILLLRLLRGPLVHRAAAGDQVDQDADQRDEQHEDEPQRLRATRQVVAAEDVDEDVDQDPDPDHPQEDLEDRPEGSEQRIGVRTSEGHIDSSGTMVHTWSRWSHMRAAPVPRPARVIYQARVWPLAQLLW